MYVELAAHNPVAALPSVTVQELKNIPCILVAYQEQQSNEKEFYQTVTGIQGEILYAENLEEARMMVLSGQGFLPVEGDSQAMVFGASLCRVPLYRGEEPIIRNDCLLAIACSGKKRTPAITWRRFLIFCAKNLISPSGLSAVLAFARAAFRIR